MRSELHIVLCIAIEGKKKNNLRSVDGILGWICNGTTLSPILLKKRYLYNINIIQWQLIKQEDKPHSLCALKKEKGVNFVADIRVIQLIYITINQQSYSVFENYYYK